jgi:serine phosphatase RsbU (regulator of sigma subunit)
VASPGEFAAAEVCRAHVITLKPGERVLLCSYGVMEGRCPAGTEFGLEQLAGFIITAMAAGELACEELCLLIQAILDH